MARKKKLNLKGKQFGRLFVYQRAEQVDNVIKWKVECDCGRLLEVRQSNLMSGRTRSCGCLQRQGSAERSPHPVHPDHREPPYHGKPIRYII